jgi:hypothetical protein
MCNKKRQKSLNKRCPECDGGNLVLVAYTENKNGVEYTKTYIECEICDYSQEFKKSEKRDKNVFNPKW